MVLVVVRVVLAKGVPSPGRLQKNQGPFRSKEQIEVVPGSAEPGFFHDCGLKKVKPGEQLPWGYDDMGVY